MIIHNLSFTVPSGKSVAIVGSTGSGKSTLMRLLYRFYEVDAGQILIDGTDITKMKVNDLRSAIAIVPQDCVLFNDTAMYNIAYGAVGKSEISDILDDKEKISAIEEFILPASQKAMIHDFIMEKPLKY